MSNFVFIFVEIILPIFFIIFIGVIMQKKFQLDLGTLAKMNIYFFSPGIIFTKLYESDLSLKLFFGVIAFSSIVIIIIHFISTCSARLLHLSPTKKMTFSHSTIFYNSGNYGIPVNDLVFKQDPLAMAIQISAMVFQNTLLFSYGVFALNSMQTGKLKALLAYFKMPLFYAMVSGITFNILHVHVPGFITTPISYISNAMVAFALFTLGAQIANIRFSVREISLYVSMFIRLLVAPAIGLIVLKVFGITGVVAQALLISTAMPTSVNSSIIAQEYNNEPEFAAQTVIASTVFSSITLTLVIYIALHVF